MIACVSFSKTVAADDEDKVACIHLKPLKYVSGTAQPIPTDAIDEIVFYWPAADPFTINFEMVGTTSVLLLANIGFSIYLIYMHLLLVLVHSCVYKLKNRGCLFQKIEIKIGSYLYWDGLIRFYMEL